MMAHRARQQHRRMFDPSDHAQPENALFANGASLRRARLASPCSIALASPSFPHASNRRYRRHRRQSRGWRRLLGREDLRQLPCLLSGCGPSLHDLENRASLISDTPAAVHPLNESLGEDIQVGHADCQSLRPFGPVRSARGQNRHISLEVRHGGEPVWIADQHLENRHLEVHCPTRTQLPRTYSLDILGEFVNLCQLTPFIPWFPSECAVQRSLLNMTMAEDAVGWLLEHARGDRSRQQSTNSRDEG